MRWIVVLPFLQFISRAVLTRGFQKQRLKSALWYSIGKIVDEETLRLGVNATPQFIGSLTELTWAQIGKAFHLARVLGGHGYDGCMDGLLSFVQILVFIGFLSVPSFCVLAQSCRS